MSRFNTPAEVLAWAEKVAALDIELHNKAGVDLNPFCTDGARNRWQRGYDGLPPRSYEGSYDFDTIYQRGRAVARLWTKPCPYCGIAIPADAEPEPPVDYCHH